MVVHLQDFEVQERERERSTCSVLDARTAYGR